MEKKTKKVTKKVTKVAEKKPKAPKAATVKKSVAPIKTPAKTKIATVESKPIAKKAVSRPKKAEKKSQVVSHGVGRRKCAVARVWLRRGKGDIKVNGKNFKKYFDTNLNRDQACLTFNVMKVENYDADVNVFGGGVNSQAEAVKLGIARALVEHNPDLRPDMKKWRLLSIDSRVKERKKYGQKGARRKFQFVKR